MNLHYYLFLLYKYDIKENLNNKDNNKEINPELIKRISNI